MKTKLIYALAFVFTFSLNGNAAETSRKSKEKATIVWGATGHRVVGLIADNYLHSRTKRKINKLLKRKSLAFVSTFADEMKADKRYNEFYTWHYINMDLDENYENAEKNPTGDLVIGIEYCKEIIKDKKSSDDDKAFYLKLLIHLVGDLHQPMHIGRKEDKGGNDVKLQWFYKDSNLHRVWDSEMIDHYGMGYKELAENADVLTKKQVKAIQEGTLIEWVDEIHVLSKEIYASVEAGENLRYKYNYNHFTQLRTQLQIGGIRLAKILNDLF